MLMISKNFNNSSIIQIHIHRGGKRMFYKYCSKKSSFLFFLLAFTKAFESVFVAFIVSRYINLAQTQNYHSLFSLSLLAIVGILLFTLFNFGYQKVRATLIKEVNIRIKNDLVAYLLETDNTLQLDASYLTNDLKQLETARIEGQLTITILAFEFLTALIAALAGNLLLTLVYFLTSIFSVALQRLFQKRITATSNAWQKSNSTYTAKVNELLKNLSVIKLYDVRKLFSVKMSDPIGNLEEALKKMKACVGYINEVVVGTALFTTIVIPFLLGVYLTMQHQITLGTFLMITQLSNSFTNPLMSIVSNLNTLKTTDTIYQKYLTAKKTKRALDLPSATNFTSLDLKQVSYKELYHELDLSVSKHEKLLWTAPSGFGKTTLFKILLGELTPDTGTYELNGAPVDRASVHAYFAHVAQEPRIFADTLRFNLCLGKDVSKEKLAQVLDLTGLTELVAQRGLDSSLKAAGSDLSGGQKQRIELARALLQERQVLLVDEGTSALDPKLSELIHQQAIATFDGTVIEIAHKLSPKEQSLFTKTLDLNELNKA